LLGFLGPLEPVVLRILRVCAVRIRRPRQKSPAEQLAPSERAILWGKLLNRAAHHLSRPLLLHVDVVGPAHHHLSDTWFGPPRFAGGHPDARSDPLRVTLSRTSRALEGTLKEGRWASDRD